MQKMSKPSLTRSKSSLAPRPARGGAKTDLDKIVVNVGIGRFCNLPNFEEKILPELVKGVGLMTGRRPATRAAKQSIAGFKIRKGNVVGLKVTLRGNRMVQFLEKLNRVVLPRIRDFRGISLKSIDVNGNLSIGIKEHITFPEIVPEQTRHELGLEITIVPKNKSREEAVVFYRNLGVPLERRK